MAFEEVIALLPLAEDGDKIQQQREGGEWKETKRGRKNKKGTMMQYTHTHSLIHSLTSRRVKRHTHTHTYVEIDA